jgi:hypothetical protein
MKTVFNLLLVLLFSILNGCAFVDRTVLKPSAELSRVPPLFTTKDCNNYQWVGEDKDKIFDLYNPFVKNDCEEQINSIKETDITNQCNQNLPLQECSAYLIRISDNICNVHLSGIFGNRAVANASLGILATGAGIAGGLVSGIGAANALSGAAGFLTGTRSLVNEEIYRNYVAEAIIKEIIANRSTRKKEINQDLVGSNNGTSSKITGVEQVKQRVSEYHSECSFYSGLSSLVGKAGLPKEEPPAPKLKEGLNK